MTEQTTVPLAAVTKALTAALGRPAPPGHIGPIAGDHRHPTWPSPCPPPPPP